MALFSVMNRTTFTVNSSTRSTIQSNMGQVQQRSEAAVSELAPYFLPIIHDFNLHLAAILQVTKSDHPLESKLSQGSGKISFTYIRRTLTWLLPFSHLHSCLLSTAAGYTQGTNSLWKQSSICGHPKSYTHLGNLKIEPNVAFSPICPAKMRKLPLKGQMIKIIVPIVQDVSNE